MQQLADREASRWVDEMAATRARDASLLSDELAEWVAKSKRLQAEVDELTKTFDTQLEARGRRSTVTDTILLRQS